MKYGEDKELERLADEWLKKHDTDKKKTYKSERQMKRKSMQEMPISNLKKNQKAMMENKFYSINEYEE